MRAHIFIPEDLIAEVDALAGKRRRSHFVEEAIREKLARMRLGAALDHTAGILDAAKHPEWDTPEKVSAWVAESRAVDRASLADKLGNRE